MLTVIALYVEPKPGNERHGERSFWHWDDQGARYCDRFWAGVHRYVPQVTRRLMLTDVPRRFEGWGLDVVPLALPGNGWWSKLEAFSVVASEGLCWYSDLDNVLLGSIDEYLALPAAPMVMNEDRYYPGMANGSTLLFDADHPAVRALWLEYYDNPRQIEREFSKWPHASDQAFIAHRLRRAGVPPLYSQHHLPPGYLLSGRDDIETGVDWSQCRLIFGAGDPKPHDSTHPAYSGWKAGWRAAA